MNRALAVAAASLALAACSPDFAPASHVDKLRVLALRADPPEIEPASATAVAPDRAALTSLVLRADVDGDPTRRVTVFYVACVPTPGDPTASECVLLTGLRDPTVILAAAAARSCAGPPSSGPEAVFAGAEACDAAGCGPVTAGGSPLASPAVALGAGYAIPAGGAEGILGLQAAVLAFAIDATPEELAQGAGAACPAGDVAARLAALWPAREHVLATKRLAIRGPDAPRAADGAPLPKDPPNQNPSVDGIAAGGVAFPASPPARVAAGTLSLTPVLPAGADALHETYLELDANGVSIGPKREEWVYSWFSTTGDLDELHTADGEPEPWSVAAAPGTAVTIAVVVRDLRGGTAWVVRSVTMGP